MNFRERMKEEFKQLQANDWEIRKATGVELITPEDFIDSIITKTMEEEVRMIDAEITDEPLYVGKTQYDFYKGDIGWVANEALEKIKAKLISEITK